MADTPTTPEHTPEDIASLIQQLRRKEGVWVEWGKACQALQKAGYDPQQIFEETGFEPIQQNQVIVGSQVYDSMMAVGVSEATQSHFGRKSSDILYELRILTHADRAALADIAFAKQLDMDEARDIAKAVKDYRRSNQTPEGFTDHPGDAIAYQAWKQARQKSDLQERSRLIAQGLKFAHSESARRQIEQLLLDFTVVPSKPAPRLPIYRLDTDDQLPRILPVIGTLPVTRLELDAIPPIDATSPFGMVTFAHPCSWIAVPGWQVIRTAIDPIVLIGQSDQLPTPLPGSAESVVIVVDRAQQDWDNDHYFLIDLGDRLDIQWFESQPEGELLGQIILIMRPKKVLDEAYTQELWQIDE